MMGLQSDLAERDDLIQQLVTKLREQIAENDQLRAELARQTEGASAYATLSDIHRNRDLPAAVRAKAASACIQHEMPRYTPEPRPLELSANDPDSNLPLAELVAKRRARQNALVGQEIEVSPSGVVRILPKLGSNGGSDDDETFG